MAVETERDISLSLVITATQHERLEQLHRRFSLSKSEIVRRALGPGLDAFENAMETFERMVGGRKAG